MAEVHRVTAIAKRKNTASAAHLTHAIVTVLRMSPAQATGTSSDVSNSYQFASHRLLARLRHVFSFAIAEGYATETPFKRHGVTVVKLETRAETPRARRLEPGEEDRLWEHAGHHLRALMVALLFL